MLVELSNVAPIEYVQRPFVENGQVVIREVAAVLNGPAVFRMTVPDNYTFVPAKSAKDLAVEVMRDITTGDPQVTHMPDQEAVIAVVNAWNRHSNQKPGWAWSDNDDFAVLLGRYFDCPVGKPTDVEETHYTVSGAPGDGPTEEN